LVGFAVMLMSMTVAEEMHQWAGQKQQVRQRCQGVTGMRPEQIASQCRKKEANHESQFRMKKLRVVCMAQSPAIDGDLSVLAGQRRPKTQSAARLPGR
jgi:hypothetical protein